jgi:transposase
MLGMQKLDGRRVSDDALEVLRGRAVAMIEAGTSQRAAAALLGVHHNTIGRWLEAWRAQGAAGLARRKRGRRPGDQMRLRPTQAAAIKKLITDRCPDQLKLPFALWTREAVQALIARRFAIDLARNTVGSYLRRWGFSPQRPVKRALEQDPERIRRWLAETYPEIAARARADGAEIHWGDETGISNQAPYGRSFAPKGQTPVVRRPGRRSTTSMISSVTNRGRLRFMVYEGALNAELFLTFLKRLIRGQQRKIILILDNLKVHHAKPVQAWVAAHSDRIELVFLPPYAPEHNPDELLNQDVKRRMAKRPAPRDRSALQRQLRATLHRLQKLPASIRAFFKAPTTAYAA